VTRGVVVKTRSCRKWHVTIPRIDVSAMVVAWGDLGRHTSACARSATAAVSGKADSEPSHPRRSRTAVPGVHEHRSPPSIYVWLVRLDRPPLRCARTISGAAGGPVLRCTCIMRRPIAANRQPTITSAIGLSRNCAITIDARLVKKSRSRSPRRAACGAWRFPDSKRRPCRRQRAGSAIRTVLTMASRRRQSSRLKKKKKKTKRNGPPIGVRRSSTRCPPQCCVSEFRVRNLQSGGVGAVDRP